MTCKNEIRRGLCCDKAKLCKSFYHKLTAFYYFLAVVRVIAVLVKCGTSASGAHTVDVIRICGVAQLFKIGNKGHVTDCKADSFGRSGFGRSNDVWSACHFAQERKLLLYV